VRADLADVRLADRVFAPHYAAPLPRVLVSAATLRDGRGEEAQPVAELAPGDAFELLDVTGTDAWGRAPGLDRVGYLPAAALGAAR
jgi:hypothetical protein